MMMMKLPLPLLALLCLPSQAFAPASVQRPSLVSLQARNDGDNNFSQLLHPKQLAAATMLSVGLLLNANAMPAMAATKAAAPVEQVVKPTTNNKKAPAPVPQAAKPAAPAKKPSAPVAPEKKAVDSARAALDAANARISAANKEASAAKAANDKATGLVKKCEAAVLQAKSQYVNENDKLTKARSNKNPNTQFIVSEQQKVADLKETERVSQVQLQNAKLTKKNAANRQSQAENNVKTVTKQREQAQKTFAGAEKKYQKYLKEKAKQEKAQAQRQKEQEAYRRKQEQKQKALAAEKARKDATEKAQRLKQEETKIKELQAARDKALQLQQESAKQAAANQARLEAEMKALADLKRTK